MRSPEKKKLGIHSIGEFVLAVPDLTKAEHFYNSFGLALSGENNHIGVRVKDGDHRWASIVERERKFLHHVTFYCFEEDLAGFKTHLESSGIRLLDPPKEFGSGGLWFRGHDGILMEIRIGPKTSPDEMSKITPSPYETGVRNAPYRRLAGKVQIQRLSHILLFTTSVNAAIQFYTNVLGLKLSDRAGEILAFFHGVHGSDHHMVAFAKSDQPGFHHASWIVPSVDQIGVGAVSMAERGYRKSWGTGRHVLGSNYFHYIQDPWGSWCEYACGIDYIPESMDWISLDHGVDDSFYLWGPDVPPEFVVNVER